MATQFTSPFYLQELAGGLNFPVGAHGFRGPVVWRRLVAGGRAAEKSCFFRRKVVFGSQFSLLRVFFEGGKKGKMRFRA